MPKTSQVDEADIVRFFEEAQLEKAETVFNIVSKRFRQRLAARATDHRSRQRKSGKAQTVPGQRPGTPAVGNEVRSADVVPSL